jgi:hypothetical protein
MASTLEADDGQETGHICILRTVTSQAAGFQEGHTALCG